MNALIILAIVAVVSINGAVGRQARMNQHWDCCKPSCKASRACAADGNTTVSQSVGSACLFGEGYACTNYQPWSINSNEGYGFVHAQFTSSSFGDDCCKCYKLVSSTGKTLTVQAIDSTHSLSHDAFDLWIPGSGVQPSYWEGCVKQWNTPNNGWGDYWTGVSKREECLSLLPKELQSGCLFRFDFWNDMRGQKVDFTEVTCPSELNAISGCGV